MSRYTVQVSDDRIKTLKDKLALATFPDELDGSGWDYGAPLADIRRLAKVWQNEFDWRAQEKKLNELPSFRTDIKIDGFEEIGVHYLHQPSPSPDAIPLLFVHGWPGSYIEISKLLSSLQQSNNGVSFHVVAPSLPNFGWSDGVARKGFGLQQHATVCHRLMLSLGYDKYVTQGGDWGFYITRTLGLLYPEACLASHINMIRASAPGFASHPVLAVQHALTPYSERERKGLARSEWFLNEGSGYRLTQSTKPQTLGYSLADSPVGLLAWIYEKLHDWTDGYSWTDDEILTWVSIYWFSTAGPTASLRIYYEAVHAGTGISRGRLEQWIPNVKLGLCHNPWELTVVPKTWGPTLGPVVFCSQQEKGGHFAAWEIPNKICSDLQNMFGVGGPCHRIIKRQSVL